MLQTTRRRPSALGPVAAGIIASLTLVSRLSAQEVPADGWIVWTSLRDGGRAESFRCRADGTEVTQLTKTGGTYPIWAPDGRWIAYRDSGDMTHLMRPDGSQNRLIGGWHLFWMHDNAGLAMLDGDDAYILDPDTGDKTPFFNRAEFGEFQNMLTHYYAMTHDRRYMFVGTGLYDSGFTGANGTFKQGYSAVLVDMLDKRKIYMVGLGCWPFTPPAGDWVYHIRGDGPTWPDIYRINLADLATRSSYGPEVAYPDPDWGHEYHPQISQDNQWMVYMASQGSHWDYSKNNEIFIHKLGTGTTGRTQVTHDDSFDAFPSIYIGSPWTAASPARLVLSPNRITLFARKATLPSPRTVLVKSSAVDAPGVDSVAVATSASWLDTSVEGNKITVSVRAGAVWRGRCAGVVSVIVPGLEGSPGSIQVVLDADESFPVAPLASVSYDASPLDADNSGFDGGAIDSYGDPNHLGGAVEPCDAPVALVVDGSNDANVPVPVNQQGSSGCGCSLGKPPSHAGVVALFLLASLAWLSRRDSRRR